MAATSSEPRRVLTERQLQQIIAAVESLRFGSVLVTVQDGKVVLIEKNEKYKV